MQRFFAILADGGRALRGHRRQVHRRRDHGRLRRPDRPRGPRAPGLLRGAADARRRLRVRGRAAPRARAQLLDPDRDQLGRGRGGGDRRQRRRRVHGDRPHRRPRPAHGGAGRARQGLPDREHGGAGARVHAAGGPGPVRDQGRQPADAGLRAWPAWARRARGSTSPASGAFRASSAATRRWRRWSEALGRAERGEGAAVGIVAEPGVGKSRLCHEFAERCRERGIEVFECQAQAHGRSIPFMPVLQMLRSYFGIGDGDPERIVREKIAGRTLLLDPELRRGPAPALRFPRRPRSPTARAPAQRRGAAPGLRGVVCRLVRAPNRRETDRRPDRGPALDGRGQRRPCSAS